MELLFDENTEVREILGFVDKDLKIVQMKSEIYTASRDLIALVGLEAYSYGVSLFKKPAGVDGASALNADEAFLLHNFQYPILLDAYSNYAPSGDISHTKNGRRMRNQSNETAAWEWMVNRNDEALEKQFYKALDNLLNLLDELNPIVKADPELKWKGTEAFQKTHRLFVRSTQDFDSYFPINSRLLLLKLQPGLSQCERVHIVPRIGKEKNEALKTALVSEGEMDEDLLELIKEACVWFALAWALRRLRVSLLPEGILQRYAGERVNTRNTKIPEKLETELTAQSFEADAERVLKAIESYTTALNSTEEPTGEVDLSPDFEFGDDDNFVSM